MRNAFVIDDGSIKEADSKFEKRTLKAKPLTYNKFRFVRRPLSAVSVFVTMALSRITPSKESTLVTDSQKLLASKPNFIQHFFGAMTPPTKTEEIEKKLERNRDQSRGFSR